MYFDEYVKLVKKAKRKIIIKKVSPNRKGVNRILLYALENVQLSNYVIKVENDHSSYSCFLPSHVLRAGEYACVYMQVINNIRTTMNGIDIFSCCMDKPNDFIIDNSCYVRLYRIEEMDVKGYQFI